VGIDDAHRLAVELDGPESGAIDPRSGNFIRVELPAPFSPMSACTVPLRHVQLDLVQRVNAGEPLGGSPAS